MVLNFLLTVASYIAKNALNSEHARLWIKKEFINRVMGLSTCIYIYSFKYKFLKKKKEEKKKIKTILCLIPFQRILEQTTLFFYNFWIAFSEEKEQKYSIQYRS